jgi:hypothetical protein
MFWTVLLWVILLAIFGTAGFAIWNLLRKVETYEVFCRTLKSELEYTLKTIKAADLRGAFEADDEVGDAFVTIKQTVMKLEEFLKED